MAARLLKTSMGISLLILAFSFPAAAKNWNQDGGITIYGNGYQSFGGWAIPWDKTPNYATANFYLKRYLTSNNDGINNIKIQPSSKPLGIIKRNTQSLNIQQEMQTTSLLSYMLYDDGELIVDEITPRFDGKIRDNTLLFSHSFGKSLTSYLLGHAICNGHIEGLDHKLNDWPLIKNTLYEGQKLIDLINMTTGDQEHVRFSDGLVKTGRGYNTTTIRSMVKNELKGSKPSQKIFNYSSLPSNLVLNYLDFRLGYKLNEFMSEVLQNHVRIAGPLVQRSALFEKKISWDSKTNTTTVFDDKSSGIYRANFRATRHDFLRIGIAILSDWREGNCVGSYLKEIYERKIRKNTVSPARNKINKWGGNYWRGYGGFFHTNLWRMENRQLIGMDGLGGQLFWIDFDKSRILYVHTVHGDYDHNKIALRVIKGEEDIYELLDIKVIDEGPTVIGQFNDRTTKYDRTVAGMKVRFKCLADYAEANDITDLPANQEIESLTANLEGNDYYRSHRQIVKAGISKEAMDTNKKALVRLVNFEGTNEEYCAKPVL